MISERVRSRHANGDSESQVGAASDQSVDRLVPTRLAEVFGALGDPTRVLILSALAARELCVGELAGGLEMTQSAISHQLRVLRNLRLVKSRRAGRSVFYSMDDAHIERLFQEGLDHVLHD